MGICRDSTSSEAIIRNSSVVRPEVVDGPLIPKILNINLVTPVRSQTPGLKMAEKNLKGPARKRLIFPGCLLARDFGTSSPITRLKKDIVILTPKTAKIWAAVESAGIPSNLITGVNISTAADPPIADERVPMNVTPICTTAKKPSMSFCNSMAVAAPGRCSFSYLFSLALGTETKAISIPEKTPFKTIKSNMDTISKGINSI
jgi:hypothetical protein